MKKPTNEYILLMDKAEQTQRRKEAKKIINKATKLMEQMSVSVRCDRSDNTELR